MFNLLIILFIYHKIHKTLLLMLNPKPRPLSQVCSLNLYDYKENREAGNFFLKLLKNTQKCQNNLFKQKQVVTLSLFTSFTRLFMCVARVRRFF